MGNDGRPWKGLRDLSGRTESEFQPTAMRHRRFIEEEPVMKNGDFRARKSGTVLLAEDDESMRGLIQLVLEARGFKVIAMVNGVEALQAYRKFADSIQIVISDVGMPGLSGVDLFREIALINPAVKVILISGHLDSRSLGQLRKAGLKHFLQKPFNPDQFLEVIDEALTDLS